MIPNCGGIPTNYSFYYRLYGNNSIPYWMNVDNSGSTAFNLQVFKCSIIITYPESLSIKQFVPKSSADTYF
jgi:hypothetical protein